MALESVTIPTVYRGDFGKTRRIDLSGIVLADDVEKELARFYAGHRDPGKTLFDFLDAQYVEVAALVVCISTAVQMIEKTVRPYFGLPRSKGVRDFLRVWRFPEAISDATVTPFEDLLLTDDRQYLSESQSTYDGIGKGLEVLEYDPDWLPNSGAKRNFFEFITFRGPGRGPIPVDTTSAAVPRKESRRWTAPLIEQVLRRHLGEGSSKEDVARVVVYEAMSNAIRHPEARVIQVVSKFDRRDKTLSPTAIHSAPEGSLRICVWDDGQSIVSTLLPLVEKGAKVRAFQFPPFMCEKILVQLRTFDKRVQKGIVIDQGEEISTKMPLEPYLLLASLFPGVSRTVADPVPGVEPFEAGLHDIPPALSYSAPGMGLYALARTVLDQFQGQLVLRSGNYRLSYEVAHDVYRVQKNVRYKCKITSYPEEYPSFRGNLLTMQLPIKSTD